MKRAPMTIGPATSDEWGKAFDAARGFMAARKAEPLANWAPALATLSRRAQALVHLGEALGEPIEEITVKTREGVKA